MAFDGGISPAECIIIFSFSFLLFAVIIVRFICHRRMHSLSDPSTNFGTFLGMLTIPGNDSERPSWRPHDRRLTGNIQERTMGTDTSVHVHGWDELRWILQLGPHLLAATAHPNQMRYADSPQEVETVKQRRQVYIRDSVIHKKVKKATTMFPALQQIEPRKDIYVMDGNLSNRVDPSASLDKVPNTDDGEIHVPISVEKQNSGDHSHDDHDEHDLQPGVPCCAICLKAYHVDDEIYWSQNPKCCHHFHSCCVEMWLLRNDNCPLCRELYLNSLPEGDVENPPRVVPTPPLRADQIEVLERGPTDTNGNPNAPNAMEAEEFMEMMVGLERLYQQANNRVILQTGAGQHFQITISRPDSPTLSEIESELFPPTR